MTQQVENHQAGRRASKSRWAACNSALGMNGVMQRLAQNRKIDTVFCDRRIFNVAEPVFEIFKSMFLRQLCEPNSTIFGRIVDGDDFARVFCQQLRQCSLTCARGRPQSAAGAT